jgi:hypothetical protein
MLQASVLTQNSLSEILASFRHCDTLALGAARKERNSHHSIARSQWYPTMPPMSADTAAMIAVRKSNLP